MLNMGLSSSQYISELSSDESESDTDSVQDNMLCNLTVDAAIKDPVQLPKPENVLSVDKIFELESKLDLDEIISLTFLLYESEHRYFASQELLVRLHDRDKKVLYKWAQIEASTGNRWQKKFIEALCIIKNYKILRELGYTKLDIIADYMPRNYNFALEVNKTYKALYLMCEKFTDEKTDIFLKKVREDFDQKGLTFNECDPDYLELFLMTWETSKYINKTDLTNIKRILKVMNEESLYTMFEAITMGTQAPQNVASNLFADQTSNFPTPSMSNELFQTSSHNSSISRNHKNSTSVDNNNQSPSDVPCNPQYVPGSYGQDHTVNVENDKPLIGKYPIDPRNPGIVLIINQEDFYTEIDPKYKKLLPANNSRKLDKRNGTEKDRDDLKMIFEKFGFEVLVENNLTHLKMINKIQEVANSVRNESSLFVCILSHGDEGVVYGSNSCGVKVRKIASLLSKTNKAHLQGKPKVLILQSCQGKDCQKINEDTDSTDGTEEENSFTTDSSNKNPLPNAVDMYTFWATVPGYAAIRHKKAGSWFIQAFCNNMKKLGNSVHFADICTSVVHEVTSKIWNRQDDLNVMTPIHSNTFRHHFYLPPLKE